MRIMPAAAAMSLLLAAGCQRTPQSAADQPAIESASPLYEVGPPGATNASADSLAVDPAASLPAPAAALPAEAAPPAG